MGIVVYLTCSLKNQRQRIMNENALRPPISSSQSSVDEVDVIMQIRRPWYEQASDITIDTDLLEPDAIAQNLFNTYMKSS